MSDLSLYEILNLVTSEIKKAQVGNVKKIIGPAGPKGEVGEIGGPGQKGDKGDKGPKGDRGLKGDKGPQGEAGKDGTEGTDGIGIARIEQDIDSSIILYLTDGTSYTVEMPLGEGGTMNEVHYKSIGGGGGGTVDLSGYVRRPNANLRDGKWLLYRETTDGKQEWTPATTDAIETNGQLMFRDSKGRFAPTPEELDELTNQLKVNRFLWDRIQELDVAAGGVAISDEAPEDPENGMFWFDNSEDVMQLFIWHKDSDAWLPVAPPTTLEGRVSQGEDTQRAIIAQIEKSLQDQATIVAKVEELSITKGAVARYVVKGTEVNVATRNGELYVNSPNAADVTYVSFAPFDSNGQATKPTNSDDIVEFVEALGGKNAGEITRYKVVSGDSNALTVEYLSGTNNFEVDEAEEVYVYPQNQDLATIEYVDESIERTDERITAVSQSALLKTGDNILSGDTDWKIKQSDSSGNSKTQIHVKSGELGLYNLKTPTEAHHAATKEYVDSNADSGSRLELDLWTYSDSAADDLVDGEFKVKEESGGVLKIYMAQKNAQGWYYHPASSATGQYSYDFVSGDQKGPPMTITNKGSRCIHFAMPTKAYFNTGTGKYTRLECKYHRSNYSLTAGDKYMLNIPGLMNPVWGW